MLTFKSHLNFLFVYLCAFTSTSVLAQDKIYLRCDGAAKVGPSANINVTKNESDKFVKIKPMSLVVTIAKDSITVNNNYELKKIPTVFSDPSTGYMFEHGGLSIKDTYYDAYYSRETYKEFKDAVNNPIERHLYSYERMRLFLDRLDGVFTWNITYYGNSWINDLLPIKAKDKYVNLEVEGKCKKETQKLLF